MILLNSLVSIAWVVLICILGALFIYSLLIVPHLEHKATGKRLAEMDAQEDQLPKVGPAEFWCQRYEYLSRIQQARDRRSRDIEDAWVRYWKELVAIEAEFAELEASQGENECDTSACADA